MTLSDDIFKYINVKGDKYILKKDTPVKIKQQMQDYIYDMKKLYEQSINIEGLMYENRSDE